MKNVLSCLGLIVVAIAAIVVGSIANGWALTMLWKWFVVPIFALAPLTIVQAIGVAMVFGLLTYQRTEKKEDRETSEIIAEVVGELFTPVIVVGVGYIVHLFM